MVQEDEDDLSSFSRDPVPPPPPDAPNEDLLEFIHYQLDNLMDSTGVVLYGLVMLGDRLQGGVPSSLLELLQHPKSMQPQFLTT